MVDFLKYKWLYFTISGFVILIGLFSILKWGFTYSIDFTGGTNLEYKFDKPIDTKKVSAILKGHRVAVLDMRSADKTLTIRTKAIEDTEANQIKDDFEKNLGTKITVLRQETVGPTIGAETVSKTTYASLIAIVAILIYMSFAFKGVTFAIAGVLALLHDVLVLVGIYSLLSHFFGAEVDPLFVTAVLTTMSFSVHDTIVVFDKIREYKNNEGGKNIEFFANKALTETMVRSLNNSMTIIFMLLALVLLGGSTITFFAFSLLVGTITGTYSSPFVATPIAVWLEKRLRR